MSTKKNDKRMKKIRIIGLIAFFVLLSIMTYLAIPVIQSLSTEEGRVELQNTVESFGALAPLFFVLFCIFQVVIAIVPGEPVEILGGILFGPFWGFLLCFIGMTLGSILVFYLVKSIGKPLLDAIISKERYAKLKFLHNEKKLEIIVFILFLIPGTPKDALTFFAPVTKIKPSRYFVYSNLARIPSIISSTLIGANLSDGNFLLSVIIFLITVAIAIIGIFFNDKFMAKVRNKGNKHGDNDTNEN